MADSPSATRIVVLDNENLVEGAVARVDDGYEIRRSVGGDITVPAKRVLAVVADRKGAFAVVAERANLRDADERLRLARWCAANGLATEALSEARIAARMRPGFKAAEQLAQTLELTTSRVPTPTDPAVVPAKAESPKSDTVKDIATIEYNSESFPMFAAKVNTILMNACASCHARDEAKVFRLTRVGGRSGATKNLMAALPHVNPKDPAASPLLVKSLTPHGNGSEAPFKTRAHPAYQTMETWVRFARSPEGTLAPETPLPDEPRKLPALGPGDQVIPAAVKNPMQPGDAFGVESKSVPGQPVKARADDPFDPAIFNGNVRPKR